MTIIEQIKTEIERLKTIQLKRIQEGDLVDAEPYDKNEAYNELLSFIDTLESEKPMNQDGLEEEFNHYCFDFKDPDTGENIPKNQISFNVEDALNVARHFAKWGAEHLSDTRKTSPKDLEEVAEEYLQKVKAGFLRTLEHPTAKDCFKDGAKWDREQMMKEAVEGEIAKDNRGNNVVRTGVFNNGFEIGDKVRIIIVKEEKE